MNAAIKLPAVTTLDTPHRFWLWAIRAWASSYSDLTYVWWSLDRAFTNEGVHAALCPFHEMMTELFAEVRRWPAIYCVLCPRMSHDEARLLNVFAQLQCGDALGARRSLRHWLPRAIAHVVCRHAEHCAAIASFAGQKLIVLRPNLEIA
jgi:hypothetical protein